MTFGATHMPRGICSGCGLEEFLPPFGDGMCFLCATDGPPGERVPTFGAIGEDGDARRDALPLSDRDFERRIEIVEEFGGHQERWGSAIGKSHYRSQRFETWARPARRDRIQVSANLGPTVEELKARGERRLRQQARTARVAIAKAQIETRVIAPDLYLERVRGTYVRRNGAGNFASQETIAAARRLRENGLSIRAVAKETGLSRQTIQSCTAWIPRPEAMRRMHAQLKANGTPRLPPWALEREKKSFSREAAP